MTRRDEEQILEFGRDYDEKIRYENSSKNISSTTIAV